MNYETRLNNTHTFIDNATNQLFMQMISNNKIGQYLDIEYNKIPTKNDKKDHLKDSLESIESMSMSDIKLNKHESVLKNMMNEVKGNLTEGRYTNSDNLHGTAGYVLMWDENSDWKSIKVENIVSITNEHGVKLSR